MFNNFIGGDGFYWFQGVVEDRNDPQKLGRVRVRILGIHTDDKTDIPTDKLPWAYSVSPIDSAAMNGIGTSPMGVVEGTWVFGFFRDGKRSQEPIIMGTFAGIPQEEESSKKKLGFHDPRGDEAAYDGQLTLSEAPRTLETKTYADDGSGATFKEENGTADDRLPQNDGKGSVYPKEDFLGEADTNRLARGIIDPGYTGSILGDIPLSIDVPVAVTTTGANTAALPRKSDCDGLTSTTGKMVDTSSDKDIEQKTTSIQDETTYPGETKWSEPESPAKSIYPFNHVKQSESGHVFEVDDTPGQERIHNYHRTGTREEIHPDGTKVTKIVGDKYDITLRDEYIHVEGKVASTVDKSCRLYINRDNEEENHFDILVGENANLNVEMQKGSLNIKVAEGSLNIELGDGDANIVSGGNVSVAAGKDVTIESGADTSINVKGNAYIKGDNDICVTAKEKIKIESTDSDIDILAETGIITMKAAKIDLNPHLS